MAGKKIQGITVEIGGDTKGLDKALKDTNKTIGATQRELKQVEKLLKLDPTNTDLLKQKQKLLGDQISTTKDKLSALKQAKKTADSEMKQGTEYNEQEYRNLQREIVNTEEQLKSLQQKSKDTGSAVSAAFETAGGKIIDFGGKVSDAGQKLMPISAAAATIGIASGKMASDFEDSMANINTLLDDDKNLGTYEKAVKDFSNETGMSLDLMGDGMYQAISSLGDGGQETVDIFGTMAKSAKAGGAEVSDSVSLISAGMKGYNQINGATAQKISDLAFQTAKLGVTTFPEMAKSMQPLFPLANSLNISYEELFGSMATLTGVTGNTAEVSTQLKSIFSSLMKPTTDMQSLIEKYGYSNAQAMLEGEGFSGVLQILQDETGGQADKLGTLLGSTEAITAMTALTGSQFDTFKDKLGAMSDATGATSTAYDKLNTNGDTVRKTINLAKNTLTELGQTLLAMVAPIIQTVSEKVKALADWFRNLDDGTKETIVKVLAVVAAIGPVVMVIGKLISGIGMVIQIVGLLMNPVGLIIAAVAAVAAGLIYLWNTNEDFRNALISAWEAVSEAFSACWDAIVSFFTETLPAAWQSVVSWFQGIPEWWNGIWMQVGQFFSDCWTAIVNFFTVTIPGVIQSVIDWFQQLPYNIGYALGQGIAAILQFGINAWNWATTEIPKIINGIVQWFSELPGKIWTWLCNVVSDLISWGSQMLTNAQQAAQNTVDAVVNWFQQLPGKLWTWLTNTVNKVIQFGSNMVSKAKEAAKNTVDGILNFFQDLPGKMLEIGGNIVSGIWNGISGAAGWLWNQISGFCSGIVDGIKDFFGIHSPSKLMEEEIGRFIPPGISVGVESAVPKALRSIRESMDQLTYVPTMRFDPVVETATPVSSYPGITFEKESIVIQTQAQDAEEIYRTFKKRLDYDVAKEVRARGSLT
jgi:phage tail tape measure protein, TP901 family